MKEQVSYRTPGFYNNVLSVGAINGGGNVAPFSGSYNDKNTECIKPDIATLGVDIESSFTKIGKQSGTSMAATILAGHSAQLSIAFPSASCLDNYNALIQSVDPVKTG
ncbi:MAG: S8 family serine peptidase [Flavobacteriaceae bacterium]|nr:S8 family serine peptidase [Flavobacteriaceae bacterium]